MALMEGILHTNYENTESHGIPSCIMAYISNMALVIATVFLYDC